MLLSAKILKNISGVNAFGYGPSWTIRAGEPNTLYFQLVDQDQGARYMPAAGSTMSVTFPNVDSSLVITVTATQPFPLDPSIWSFSLSNVQIPASGNVLFSITESTVTRTFSLQNAISVDYPGQDGSC